MDNELKTRLAGMNDSELAEVADAVSGVRNARTAIDLSSIRPGMKSEDIERTRAEIVRILKEGR